MKLPYKVKITPPKTSDQKGNIITPSSFDLDSVQLTFIDNNAAKIVNVNIHPFPTPLKLWHGKEYDEIGDWTQKQAEDKVLELLGDDVQKSLNNLYPATLESDPSGPGTILSKMLSKIGIKSSPTCSCKQRAITMNKNGIEWCENNIEIIVGWLKEESEKRKLPFVEFVAKTIINRAIKQSKKIKEKENKSIDKA